MAEDPGAIREAIEETRQELAETVQALGEKADVKAQLHRKADDLKGEARRAIDEKVPDPARPVLEAVAPRVEGGARAAQRNRKPLAIGAAAVLVLVLLRRRRARRAA